jgi:hypothetical protein
LFVKLLEQRDAEHAIESVDANLAIGPVMHRSPTQPVAILESPRPCQMIISSPLNHEAIQAAIPACGRPAFIDACEPAPGRSGQKNGLADFIRRDNFPPRVIFHKPHTSGVNLPPVQGQSLWRVASRPKPRIPIARHY